MAVAAVAVLVTERGWAFLAVGESGAEAFAANESELLEMIEQVDIGTVDGISAPTGAATRPDASPPDAWRAAREAWIARAGPGDRDTSTTPQTVFTVEELQAIAELLSLSSW